MNPIFLSAALLLTPLTTMSTGGDDAKRQVIDPATSTITWEGKKVTASLNPIRAENGMNFAAQGTVTIKGRTVEVSFPVKLEIGDASTTISGEMVLDRSEFDVRFRSKSFFDASELGDKLIYDDFTIGFSLSAS